jgi:hypothetical protein
MTFRAWVAAQAERYGSDAALAAVLDIDPTTAGDWRRGHCFPRPDLVERLAAATGTSEVWLIALVHEGRKAQALAIRATARKPLARVTGSPVSVTPVRYTA